jgi:hypothetical protein
MNTDNIINRINKSRKRSFDEMEEDEDNDIERMNESNQEIKKICPSMVAEITSRVGGFDITIQQRRF